MSINIKYVRLDLINNIQSIAPISSVQNIHQNSFKKNYNNKKKNDSSNFEEILDEKIKVYKKDTQK